MPDGVAQSAIEIFEKEQKQYSTARTEQANNTSGVVIPEKITSVGGQQDENGQWIPGEKEVDPPITRNDPEQDAFDDVKSKPEKLRQFCKTVDDRILAYNAQIYSLKQQIVTLSTEAIAGNCWPGIACSVTLAAPTTCLASTQDYSTSTSFKEDRDVLSIYTNMDGPSPNYDAVNPFNPDTTVGLTTFYSGYGRANTKDDNGGTTIGVARLDVSTTLSNHNARSISTSRYYVGAGVAPYATNTSVTASRCVAIANSIASLESQITTIRAQRDSLRSNLNIVKAEKGNKDLQAWGLINQERKISSQATSKASIIAAINSLS